MVELLDVVLPIISLIVFALLTLPVFRVIRKNKRKTALTLAWFFTVFAVTGAAVANLTLKYYSLPSPQPFLNITVTGESFAALSSAFMIDAVSVYMAIIFTVVSAVVFLYSVFYVDSSQRPSERYFAVMLMLTAALIGAVFSGDLLTMFIFWEAAAAGLQESSCVSEFHVEVFGYDNYCFGFCCVWAFDSLRVNWHVEFLGCEAGFDDYG